MPNKHYASLYNHETIPTDPSWYPNAIATHQLTSDLNNLTLHSEDYVGTGKIEVGNGASFPIHHIDNTQNFSPSKKLFLHQLQEAQ